MPIVKTFTSDLRIFKTAGQLDELDKKVNDFLHDKSVKTVHSISDSTVSDDTGATIGLIRVLVYD